MNYRNILILCSLLLSLYIQNNKNIKINKNKNFFNKFLLFIISFLICFEDICIGLIFIITILTKIK